MSVTNQWGKRLSTDAPIAEPDAQRRRLDARTMQDSLSVKSRAARRSPFDTLPGEVIRHLCQQMTNRTQGTLAQCSTLFSTVVQQVRWDKAGSLVEQGKLHPTESHNDHVHFQRGTDKLPGSIVSWLRHNEALTRPPRGEARMSDQEIGFWLGCRYPHVSLSDAVTPQLMAGLSTASRWRSLSLKVDLRHNALPALLTPLIDGLAKRGSARPRELFLEIHGDWSQSSVVVPDGLWNGRLELVGLTIHGFQAIQQIVRQFERGYALRYLSLLASDDQRTVDLLKSIGTQFPALEILRLISLETTWVPDDACWMAFQRDHPHLQTISLVFDESPPAGWRAGLLALDVRYCDLTTSSFSDTEGCLAEWVEKSQRLQELHIAADTMYANLGKDFRQLVKAISANQSLRTLSIKGIIQKPFEYAESGYPFLKYDKQLMELLAGVAANRQITDLGLTFNLREFIKSEHSSKSQVLAQFESLESVKPGLSLNFADMNIGAAVTETSPTVTMSANEFVHKFGWKATEHEPEAEDSVDFQVELPTWGQGAFRKMISYWGMGYEDRKKFILNGLSDGSLPKHAIRLLGAQQKNDPDEAMTATEGRRAQIADLISVLHEFMND